MSHRVDMDECGKSRPPPGFDLRTVQPVASRYTYYAKDYFPRGIADGRKADLSLELVRMLGATSPLPPYHFMA